MLFYAEDNLYTYELLHVLFHNTMYHSKPLLISHPPPENIKLNQNIVFGGRYAPRTPPQHVCAVRAPLH